MNPATAFATVLADELIRCGLREAVLAPGSRSTPLALALHDRAAAGDLRLHVRIDERSAAFTALGLAKAARRPAAVMCTSGTAAAHFHPAVIEADEAGLPLIVITADRPPELRGTGANQTIDQLKLYGGAVRWFCETGVPEARAGMAGYWRSLACRAWALAGGQARAPRAGAPERGVARAAGAGRRRRGRPGGPGDWPEPLVAGRAAPRGRASLARARAAASGPALSWTGPSAAWWSAGTGTTIPRRSSSWPRRPAGRCWPSRRRTPAGARTHCRPTATCWRRRPSPPRTGLT